MTLHSSLEQGENQQSRKRKTGAYRNDSFFPALKQGQQFVEYSPMQEISRLSVSVAVALLAASLLLSGRSQAQSDADPPSFFEGRFRREPAPPIFTRPETRAVLPNLISSPEDASPSATPAASPAQGRPQDEGASRSGPAGPARILKNLIAPAAEAAAEPPAPPKADINLPPPEPAPPAEIATGATGERSPPRHADIDLPPPEPAQPAVLSRDTKQAVARRGNRIGVGTAVWYQHPGRTASGEIYNPNGLTAAHRTLPFGTLLRVVNQRNGRAVTVRINDRGPPQRRFVIDLSRGAARVLGITGVGSVALYDIGDGRSSAESKTPTARFSPLKAQRWQAVATTGSIKSRSRH